MRAAPDKLWKREKQTPPESKLSKYYAKQIKDHLLSMTASLDFPSEDANDHFTASPTYHLQTYYRRTGTVMQTAHCLLDIEAGVNLIRSSRIPSNCPSHIERDGLPMICTAAEQPLPLNGLILLTLRTADFTTGVWHGIVLQLAVEVLLGKAFVDRFIRVIFLSELKEVP